MITVRAFSPTNYTMKFLKTLQNHNDEIYGYLRPYGQKGVAALSAATPMDSGKTAHSWSYKIILGKKTSSIIWENDNVNDGQNVAILLQYGHGTKGGKYVAGYDYINPAIKPIFDDIERDIWNKIISS